MHMIQCTIAHLSVGEPPPLEIWKSWRTKPFVGTFPSQDQFPTFVIPSSSSSSLSSSSPSSVSHICDPHRHHLLFSASFVWSLYFRSCCSNIMHSCVDQANWFCYEVLITLNGKNAAFFKALQKNVVPSLTKCKQIHRKLIAVTFVITDHWKTLKNRSWLQIHQSHKSFWGTKHFIWDILSAHKMLVFDTLLSNIVFHTKNMFLMQSMVGLTNDAADP